MSDELIPGSRQGMQIGQAIGKAIAALVAVVGVPIALLTQMVFKKDLGERYASGFRRGTALVLLVAAGALHAFAPMPAFVDIAKGIRPQGPVLSHPSSTVLGLGLLVLFGVLVGEHAVRLRARYQTDARWHSRSLGVNRIPFLGIGLQMLVAFAAATGLFFLRLDYFAILFLVSGVFGAIIEEHARKEFYHRVLDVVDGQIEAEMVGKAVKERLGPKDAKGLQTRLPAYVSDEARQRIARAVEGHRGAQVDATNKVPRPTSQIDPKSGRLVHAINDPINPTNFT